MISTFIMSSGQLINGGSISATTDSQNLPISSDIELVSMFRRWDVCIDGIGFVMRAVLCKN